MFIRFGIVLSLLGFLSACAVVEPLTGGEDDEFAPKPNMEKMLPLNGTTNYNGKEIRIPFDEFFSLNAPSENIIVIPPDIKPKAKIKNKTLVLSWDEDLKPNTTYAFYLNGVVQDLNEKNDSLMSFVFSTGSFIDSLSAQFEVRDAFDKKVMAAQTVGLYSKFNDTILPNYFGKTDNNGIVQLHYLKPGDYDLIAFDDKNKNLKADKNENFGFRITPVSLSETIVDSGAILISPPKSLPKISSLKLNPPSTFFVGANRSLEKARFELNGKPLSDEHVVFIERDSVLIPFEWSDSSSYELVVSTDTWRDTSDFRILPKDRDVDLTLKPINAKDILPNESIRFYSNHFISFLEIPNIRVINAKDSSTILLRRIKHLGAIVELDFDRKDEINDVIVDFLPLSVQSEKASNSDTLSFKLHVKSPRDVGKLMVSLEGFSSATIIQVLSNDKIVETEPLAKGTSAITFENLTPGDYFFRVIIDVNENGRWDGGDYSSGKQPEEVTVFEKPTRVRGNWDTEIILQKDGR